MSGRSRNDNLYKQEIMRPIVRTYLTIFMAVGIVAEGFLLWHLLRVNARIEQTLPPGPQPVAVVEGEQVVEAEPARQKPAAQTVKGLYLTAYSAQDEAKMDEIIKLINETELNAVVIDIKDYTGYILYDSQVPLVQELGTKKVVMENVPAIINKLHEHKIYTIARQTVFQDPALASKKPEWAIKSKAGGLWRDKNGLTWVDATKQEVWEYNIAIAKEAVALGFDEINFDYVRFPSDGNIGLIKYSTGNKKRYEVMGEFYAFLGSAMAEEPAWISLDLFGLVMEPSTHTYDMGIGQRLADAVDHVDYICPMMYPSHYPTNHLGLKNPAAYPGTVIENGMKKGDKWFRGRRAKVRPWLQAFNIGAVYDGTKIRAQIDAVEKFSDAGWLLWNAGNRYTKAGLQADENNASLRGSADEALTSQSP